MTDTYQHLDWEYYVDQDTQVPEDLEAKTRERLFALAEGHNDFIGASVAVERPASHESAVLFQARVIAYVRPENIVAVQKAETAAAALNAAVDAVERQVREKRERLA